MYKISTLILFLIFTTTNFYSQEIEKINFIGLKRTKESFLRKLVIAQENSVFDSVVANKDIERLKRLPGIANAKFTTTKQESGKEILNYEIVENFTIIPGLRVGTANNGDFAYRLSVFEFNLMGNNQLVGGFYQKEVFDSYGLYYENPFLFGRKLGLGFSHLNVSSQEPIYFDTAKVNYQFFNKTFETNALFSFDFNNEAELGVSYIQEKYEVLDRVKDAARPQSLAANKLTFRSEYRYVDIDINYQYLDGMKSEFLGQYFNFLNGNNQGEIFLKNYLLLKNDFVFYKKIKNKGNWATRLTLSGIIGNESSVFAPFAFDNDLNIRGIGNTVERGTAAITLNTEYRHTLLEKGWFVLQGNTFIDSGTLRQPGENFSQLFNGETSKLYSGFGLRFIHKKIFNAVIRLDYGFAIKSNSTNGLTFGIGQYF